MVPINYGIFYVRRSSLLDPLFPKMLAHLLVLYLTESSRKCAPSQARPRSVSGGFVMTSYSIKHVIPMRQLAAGVNCQIVYLGPISSRTYIGLPLALHTSTGPAFETPLGRSVDMMAFFTVLRHHSLRLE